KMASREGDTALWLHNKLGSTDDLWSGRSICSQLTQDKLQSIQNCFHSLQPYVKVKLMLSFIHIPQRNIEQWRSDLEYILDIAMADSDQWVSMVAEIFRPYPRSGTLNLEIDPQNSFFQEHLSDLKKLVKKSSDAHMLPMESLYLGKNAITAVAGQQPQPVKNFTLKRKPKSAALRAELLQKSTEVACNLKNKPGDRSMPFKMRSFAKKMDDTTPLKGIRERVPSGSSTPGFIRTPISHRLSHTPISGTRTPANRKEGGIKLLDINEVPLGTKEAKKRRRQAEQDERAKEKEASVTTVTPDYAAGLMSPMTNITPITPVTPKTDKNPFSNSGPTYTPQSSRLPSASTGGTTVLPVSGIGSATQQARNNLSQQLQSQLKPTQPSEPPGVVAGDHEPVPPTQNSEQNSDQPAKKGLSLTREQMLEAQEMFRNSNRVTRPEKALILGFMAGSRENPCKDQGDIVNVRLSESNESVKQFDGLYKPMVVDHYFQMNYATGEWRRVQKYREIEIDPT
ncbi:unnamed protein product, partial [Owenia fusiformis]